MVCDKVVCCVVYLLGHSAHGTTGFGSHWGADFAGTFAYADDIALFAPSASALRIMLGCCESFSCSHGLVFNPSKTCLIQFSKRIHLKCGLKDYFLWSAAKLTAVCCAFGACACTQFEDIGMRCRDMVGRENAVPFRGWNPQC